MAFTLGQMAFELHRALYVHLAPISHRSALCTVPNRAHFFLAAPWLQFGNQVKSSNLLKYIILMIVCLCKN